MPDTVMIDGQEWSLEGLPRHMYEHLPLTVEVVTEVPMKFGVPYPEDQVRLGVSGFPVATEKTTVQLERDGKPLTFADQARGWTAGEREGWKPWPVAIAEQAGDELEGEVLE